MPLLIPDSFPCSEVCFVYSFLISVSMLNFSPTRFLVLYPLARCGQIWCPHTSWSMFLLALLAASGPLKISLSNILTLCIDSLELTAGHIPVRERPRPKTDMDSDLWTMFSFGAKINSKKSIIVVILVIHSIFSKIRNSIELCIHSKIKITSKSMSYSVLREIMFYLTPSWREGSISLFTHRLPL